MTQDKEPVGNPVRAFLLTPLIGYLLISLGMVLVVMDAQILGRAMMNLLPFAIFTYVVSAGFASLFFRWGGRLSFITTVVATSLTALFLIFLVTLSEFMNGGDLFGQCIAKGAGGLPPCDYGRLMTGFLVILFMGAFYGVVFWLLYRPQKSAAT